MKRLSALVAKFEEDMSDSGFEANYHDKNYAPNNNNNLSDNESVSEGSRKIRKKRDVYHKISDEIRVKLLESVQNGETLKSAAKRFKINYSSAKSILHTYRKEGRILKKSAQERTTKKKVTANSDNEPTQPVTKASKRESSKRVVAPLAERITTATTCASNEETGSGLNENLVSILKMEHYGAQQEDAKTLARPPMVHVNYNTAEPEDHHRQKNPKLFDNFYMGYNDYNYQEVAGDYQGAEAADYTNAMYQSTEFDPFSDMMSALQPKGQKNEEVYHDPSSFFYSKGFNTGYGYEEKNGKLENGVSYEDNLENTGNPLKSFMDTQKLLQDAFRKANYMGGSGTQGFRKSSFDLF